MISKKTFSLKSLLAITSLVVALNSTVSNAGTPIAAKGAGLVKSTHFGWFAPHNAWSPVLQNGAITGSHMDAPKDGKKVVLNKLVEPTRDNQYRLGVRSTHEGGELTLEQNGHDIACNPIVSALAPFAG